MLLNLFYRKNCFKSLFLRVVLREMGWELRECDVGNPVSESELLLFKEKHGGAQKVIAPAIYTPEVYSHELFCILEYLQERNPGASMYPPSPHLRLYARSTLASLLKGLVPAWNDYQKTGAPAQLLELYSSHEEIILALIKSPATVRAMPEVPTYLEVALALMAVEAKSVVKDKTILRWLNGMSKRPAFRVTADSDPAAYP